MITNKWVPCTDDNYWTDDPNYITIVKYRLSNEDNYTVKTQYETLYGWNILCSI